MQQRLQETVDHLRQHIDPVDEPQFKAMLEIAVEAVTGLKKGAQRLRTEERKHMDLRVREGASGASAEPFR